MLYRENQKNGDMLSILGYGCMRYTKKGASIDQKKAEAEMAIALKQGVNYFDTAYIYTGSEVCLGKFMKNYGCREQIKVADKLPQYFIKKLEDLDKYFDEQLSRLQTTYIDYYLMHMLNDHDAWQRLCDLGVEHWIEEKKKSGEIKNIGFSFHGGTQQFKALIDAYDWDFCQIQFNYMDEYAQAGIEGLNYAHEKGIPVMIMEPLRGGKLAGMLPDAAKAEFAKEDGEKGKRSPAEWGLRWIWNHEQVNVVLSGMNAAAQVEENCRIAADAEARAMSAEELEVFERVKKAVNSKVKVGCTGCGYCMPCPKGVDIPVCFQAYNRSYSDNMFNGMKDYLMCTALRRQKSFASMCAGCGKCETHCPQSIEIRKELAAVRKRLENPVFKAATAVLGRFYRY